MKKQKKKTSRIYQVGYAVMSGDKIVEWCLLGLGSTLAEARENLMAKEKAFALEQLVKDEIYLSKKGNPPKTGAELEEALEFYLVHLMDQCEYQETYFSECE